MLPFRSLGLLILALITPGPLDAQLTIALARAYRGDLRPVFTFDGATWRVAQTQESYATPTRLAPAVTIPDVWWFDGTRRLEVGPLERVAEWFQGQTIRDAPWGRGARGWYFVSSDSTIPATPFHQDTWGHYRAALVSGLDARFSAEIANRSGLEHPAFPLEDGTAPTVIDELHSLRGEPSWTYVRLERHYGRNASHADPGCWSSVVLQGWVRLGTPVDAGPLEFGSGACDGKGDIRLHALTSVETDAGLFVVAVEIGYEDVVPVVMEVTPDGPVEVFRSPYTWWGS